MNWQVQPDPVISHMVDNVNDVDIIMSRLDESRHSFVIVNISLVKGNFLIRNASLYEIMNCINSNDVLYQDCVCEWNFETFKKDYEVAKILLYDGS